MNNPFKYYLDERNTTGFIVVKAWLKGGSKLDPPGQRGIHQLLSALLTRGCGPYGCNELADLIEGCGAGLRCETNEDGILISLKCAADDIYRLLPLIKWMITDPHLQEEQIRLEKDLTSQCLIRQKENPFHLAFDGWRSIAFNGGPYGHDPLGVLEEISTLTKNNLISISHNIRNNQNICVISGSIPEDIEEFIGQSDILNIQNIKESSSQSINTNQLTSSTEYLSNIHKSYEETNQVVMILGQSCLPHGHQAELALRLLSMHIGGGMSSKLFQKLREENGVAYDVGLYYPIREMPGPFVIHASTTEEKAEKTLKLMEDIWWSMSQKELSNEELALSKAKFRGKMAYDFQTISQKAARQAYLLALKYNINYDTIALNAIDSIKSQDIIKAAKSHLSKPLLSLCGSKKVLDKLELRCEK